MLTEAPSCRESGISRSRSGGILGVVLDYREYWGYKSLGVKEYNGGPCEKRETFKKSRVRFSNCLGMNSFSHPWVF